jgi:replicative DNA helicase
MANAAHLDANSPLFVGFEMSQEEQMDRLISLRARVNLNHILNGTTTRAEDKRMAQAYSRMQDMRPFMFCTDTESALTVAGIGALIQEKNPDVVFIDGIYFMRSALPNVEPGSPQALTDISRSLKRLCQSSKKPIVVTSQASQTRTRGDRLTLASGMYTQAFGQDANIVLGTARMSNKREEGEDAEDEDTGPVTVRFNVIASRSGPRKEVMLEWNWDAGLARELDVRAMNAALNPRTNPTSGTADNQGFAP